jgi:hypothetical protein
MPLAITIDERAQNPSAQGLSLPSNNAFYSLLNHIALPFEQIRATPKMDRG